MRGHPLSSPAGRGSAATATVSVADPLSVLLAARADVPVAPLHVAYTDADAARLLADPGLLAVVEFAAAPLPSDDARHIVVGLALLSGTAPREVWRTTGTVQHGSDGALRWSCDGDWCQFSISVDEAMDGIEAATATAYAAIAGFLKRHPALHALRLWNYFDKITDGDGDDERYRRFCVGRDDGLDGFFSGGYPAATAIGSQGRRGVLQVYGLASREPGKAIENPRQLSAWRYPREYGPVAPGFARAMQAGETLLISGTAAIVGHQSRFDDDLAGQTDEMLENLHSLLRAADAPERSRRGAGLSLKAYVRGADDVDYVERRLRQALPELSGLLVLAGMVCRRELVVEIDGQLG